MLDPRGPSETDEAWVRQHLNPGELALWAQMSGPDRRHAVAVARRAVALAGADGPEEDVAAHGGSGHEDDGDGEVVPAALLHDVGKLDAGLGALGRVAATLAGIAAPRAASSGSGRLARYLTHDRRGAAMLAAAGSGPVTVAWAREHHLPPERWTVPDKLAAALKAADDD